jgi:hypothetical protein
MRMGQIARKAMGLGTAIFISHPLTFAARVARVPDPPAEPKPLIERRLITAMRKLDPDLAAMLENLI